MKKITELRTFFDRRRGHHHILTVVRCLLALISTKSLVKYFLIYGHSFLPGDRGFNTANRLIRRLDSVFVPEQYYELSSKEKFGVKNVSRGIITDHKKWWSLHRKVVISADSFGRGVTRDQKYSFSISPCNDSCTVRITRRGGGERSHFENKTSPYT